MEIITFTTKLPGQPTTPSTTTTTNVKKPTRPTPTKIYSLGSIRTPTTLPDLVTIPEKVEAYPLRIVRQCQVTVKRMVSMKGKTNQPVLVVRKTGEVPHLSYNHVTIAYLWPGFDLKDSVQINPYHLKNLGCQAGEKVQLIQLPHETDNSSNPRIRQLDIHKLELEVLDQSSSDLNEQLKPYFSQLLDSLELLCPGNRLELFLSGKELPFRVNSIHVTLNKVNIELRHDQTRTNDSDPFIIGRMTPTTQIHFTTPQATESKPPSISYDNIGGLKHQMAEIRAIIELPLGPTRKAFSDNGLSLPRGLLLYGPPGTGKTMIARAAAHSAGVTPFLISAPELISRFVGETENKIKELFNKARANQPSIICFDELDALCPRRDKSQSEMEKRTVATFLTLMDGIGNDSEERVMVIGTTNRPHAIDPALRRPGRFDVEIEIGIPDGEGRMEILEKLLASTPHNLSPSELRSISDKAHGYVGADLAVLVKEAGLSAIRRHIATLRSSGTAESDVMITRHDLETVFNVVRPSAMREVAVEVPKVYWKEIGGQHEIRQKLREAIEWPLKHPEIFTQFGIRPPRGVLLYGPPGCSKTLMAKALATEAQVNFLLVKGPELFNQWVGESEKAVREIFRKARAAAPAIIFLDEMDALTVRRGASSSVAERVLAQFLTEMDGIDALNNVTVVGATNRPDIIDPALLRPGRIDRLLYVGAPDTTTREEIFKIQSRRMPFAADVDFAWLAEQTEGCSGAEVVGLCQDAAMAALELDLHTSEVARHHFQSVLHRGLHRNITPEMLNFFHTFQQKSPVPTI